MNMEQTILVEDFILPEVELSDIKNYDSIPMVTKWLTCSEWEAERAAHEGQPVVMTHAGNWYGVMSH